MKDWQPIRGVTVDVTPLISLGMTEWEMYPERFGDEPRKSKMTDSLQVTDDLSAAVATAPRITKAFIEDQIARIIFITGDNLVESGDYYPDPSFKNEGAGLAPAPEAWRPLYAHHTVCVMATKAGFTVIGHSAPASPENFDAELGRQLAYENAFRQLWPLFAFAALEMVEMRVTYGDFGQQF